MTVQIRLPYRNKFMSDLIQMMWDDRISAEDIRKQFGFSKTLSAFISGALNESRLRALRENCLPEELKRG